MSGHRVRKLRVEHSLFLPPVCSQANEHVNRKAVRVEYDVETILNRSFDKIIVAFSPNGNKGRNSACILRNANVGIRPLGSY